MITQHVVTCDEMKKMDQITAKAKNMSSYELMRYAADQIYRKISTLNLCSKADEIIVLAGPGNNGGDALVIAEKLIAENYHVVVYVVKSNHQQTLENKKQIELLKANNTEIHEIDNLRMSIFQNQLKKSTCLIDGLIGIGFKSPMDPLFYDVIKNVNQSKINVISVDIPSGLCAKNGLAEDIAIIANYTMIIGKYKVGNLIQDALDYQGQTHFIDIGIHDLTTRKRLLIKQTDEMNLFSKRKHHTNKYDYGHVLVIGGSKGMIGAPILSASAALRSGAGLVSMLIDETIYPFMKNVKPEIMVKPYIKTEALDSLLDYKKTIVYGVGLGKENDHDIIDYILKHKILTVVDADGITHLKKRIKENHNFQNIIITPHLGELSNLLNMSSNQCQKDILSHIENLAVQTKMTICFKGPCTIIANASETFFAQLGNPGLAKAGSGDVLSGIISSFLAQKNTPIQAALKGAYLHGLSANIATKTYGETTLIASDIINHLHIAIKNTSN